VNCTNNSVRGAELLLHARAPPQPGATPHAKPVATARGELAALSLLSPARGPRAHGPPLFSHIGSALEWARDTLGAAGACSGARAQAFDSMVLCLGLLGNSVEHSERAQALLLSSSSSSASASSFSGHPRALLSPTVRCAAGSRPPAEPVSAEAPAAPLAEAPQGLLALVGAVFAAHHNALQAGLEEGGSGSGGAFAAGGAGGGGDTGIGQGGCRPAAEQAHLLPAVNDSVVIAAYAALVLAAVLAAPGAAEDAADNIGGVSAPQRAAIVLDAVAPALVPLPLGRTARADAAATATPSAGAAAAALLFVLRAFARLQSEAGVLTAEMAAHLAGGEARVDAAAASYTASARGPAAPAALLPLAHLPPRVGTSAAGAAADGWAAAADASSACRVGAGAADGGCRNSPARASPRVRQRPDSPSPAAASSGRRDQALAGVAGGAGPPPLPTSAARIAAAHPADGAAGAGAAGAGGSSSSARSTGSSAGLGGGTPTRTRTRTSAVTPPLLQRSASTGGSPARTVSLLAASQGMRLPSSPARTVSAPLDVGSPRPVPLQPAAKGARDPR
jgi:hypothetical protein